MQQGGSSYGVTQEVPSAQHAGGGAPAASGGRGHMMGGGQDMSSAGGGSVHHPHSDQKASEPIGLAEAASPISSRSMSSRSTNLDELLQRTDGGSGLRDDNALAEEEEKRGTSGGNRWPRQETLALLKIRSDMDATFRDATLKGPLWDEVSRATEAWLRERLERKLLSPEYHLHHNVVIIPIKAPINQNFPPSSPIRKRKLAELGYHRSSKKCKEKFENVHKYYKRTKEGRAGRQDGKSYRFFTELEALHGGPTTTSTTGSAAQTPVTMPAPGLPPQSVGSTIQSSPIAGNATTGGDAVGMTRIPRIQPSNTILMSSIPPSTHSGQSGIPWTQNLPRIPPTDLSAGITLSSGGSSTSGDSSEDDRKRKRPSAVESSTQKMMNFLEKLMKQVVEKQMALQQRFLETIERREDDRMIREEAWKRQEMARLSRELDILAQERAMSASRAAAVIAFLQKITGQTIPIPTAVPPPPIPSIPSPPQQPIPPILSQPPPQQQKYKHHQHQHHQHPSSEAINRSLSTTSMDVVSQDKEPIMSTLFDPSSSRWPKPEVLALIKLRNGLESRYQEAGPKGPLWEEISGEMAKLGYKRSAKRCKEKWENINKYYKKVKESNKKRPEDSKTCPYFHELDALYRKKGHGSRTDLEMTMDEGLGIGGEMVAIMPTPISAAPPEPARPDREGGGDGENGRGVNCGGSGAQIQKDNGSGF